MLKPKSASSSHYAERPPRRRRAKIRIALGVAVIGAGVLMSASPAYATDHGCNNNNAIDVCLTITGSGQFVNSFDIVVYNNTAASWSNTHFEIQAPNGGAWKNSDAFTMTADSEWGWLVGVQADVAVGSWCAIVWHYNGSGYQNFGEQCEPVDK
jgi:hypothetical protein